MFHSVSIASQLIEAEPGNRIESHSRGELHNLTVAKATTKNILLQRIHSAEMWKQDERTSRCWEL